MFKFKKAADLILSVVFATGFIFFISHAYDNMIGMDAFIHTLHIAGY